MAGLRMGSVVIQFYTEAWFHHPKVLQFANAMVDTQANPVLIHQVVEGGHTNTYQYESTDIKALIILPGDWTKLEVDSLHGHLELLDKLKRRR